MSDEGEVHFDGVLVFIDRRGHGGEEGRVGGAEGRDQLDVEREGKDRSRVGRMSREERLFGVVMM